MANPAQASLTKAQLDTIAARPDPGASVPLDTVLSDQKGRREPLLSWLDGRPALLVLADYRCTQVCGPILSIAARALDASGLNAPTDFNLLVVDFNTGASGLDGEAMRRTEFGLYPGLDATARFLTGTPNAIAALERALGYTAVEDRDANRFAHPTTVFVLTSQGRVARTLDGLALDADTLRLSLVEAGQGRLGSLADRIHVLCYGLDAASARYTGRVIVALQVGAGLTLLGTVALLLLTRRRRQSA